MLKVNTLSCERDGRELFSKLTFKVSPGTAVVVLGANGVGKSSLLKILTGLWQPSEGSIIWKGQRVCVGDPAFLSEILYIGHKIGILPALTPLQNLKYLIAITQKLEKTATTEDIIWVLEAVGLKGFEDIPCEALSKGQCQRVALARLWLNPPRCWILDEPFTALDDQGKDLLHNRFLAHLKEEGILIIASHHKIGLNPFPTQEIPLREMMC